MKKILAITACPTGVAHTYMAAENLEKKARSMGYDIKVETHGSIGKENEFTEKEIKEAVGIIIAADTGVDLSRFNGKHVLQTSTQAAIKTPEKLITSIINKEAPILTGNASSAQKESVGRGLYKYIMNGVSHMIPFVVTGGLLIAISLALGGDPTPQGLVIPETSMWFIILKIGVAAIGLMVPVMSAYIAYSIADRPGLVPGFVGGLIAVDGSFYGSSANAGFLGGILTGLMAGYVALAIKKIKVPKAVESVMPIIFIPILSTLIVGLTFSFFIGQPVAALFTALTNWLASMQGANSVVLAIILGSLIAFDMGGPFNKTAFMFGSAMIASGNYAIMGAVAVAICIPPIGMGLSTLLFPKKFDQQSKDSGKASLTMGFFGITEGAIPFATQDPLRAIPSNVIGASVGAVIAMLSGVGDHVAHGGPIVALLGAVDNILMFFVAAAIGSLVTAVMYGFLKKDINTEVEEIEFAKEVETQLELNKLTDIMSEDLIEMDLTSNNKEDAFEALVSRLQTTGVVKDKEQLLLKIKERESESTTGIGMGIAIPHAKTNAVSVPRVVFGKSTNGIEWKSLDGELVNLVFLIAIPEQYQGETHLKILQMLSRKLMDEKFRKDLNNANSKKEVYSLLETIDK